MSIIETFKKTIARHGLIRKKDRIIVGVSGGPDSVALLFLLAFLRKEYGLTLFVAHLDHMLRPESRADRRFVQALARRLGCEFYSAKVNVDRLAEKGSLEEAARQSRLSFFLKVAKKLSADSVALGHTVDDQAETVLMRVLRGSGLYGLAGIMPRRKINGMFFIRPLIEVRRKEIESFLKRKKISFRLDASNKEDLYFRNKIRNRLIPLLAKEFSPGIKDLLAHLAESARYDYDYLSMCAKRSCGGGRCSMSLSSLSKAHTAIRRILLRNAYASLKGDTRRLTFSHIKEIEDMLVSRPTGSVVDLPRGISAKKNAKNLIFFRRKNSRNA